MGVIIPQLQSREHDYKLTEEEANQPGVLL